MSFRHGNHQDCRCYFSMVSLFYCLSCRLTVISPLLDLGLNDLDGNRFAGGCQRKVMAHSILDEALYVAAIIIGSVLLHGQTAS